MKKQLLFAFAVLGVQSTQPMGGVALAIYSGKKVMMVDTINQIPQIPATISEGDIYSVLYNDIDGKVTLKSGNKDGIKISCGYRGRTGYARCKIWFKEAGKYGLEQMVDGVKMTQHINVVKGKSTPTKAKRKAEQEEKKAKKQKRNDQ